MLGRPRNEIWEEAADRFTAESTSRALTLLKGNLAIYILNPVLEKLMPKS